MGDLGKLIVAKGFKNLTKVQKIAQSGHTGMVQWQHLNYFLARQCFCLLLPARQCNLTALMLLLLAKLYRTIGFNSMSPPWHGDRGANGAYVLERAEMELSKEQGLAMTKGKMIQEFLGGSPGLVVMGQTHVQKVVGLNPGAIYWMDFCIVCLKWPKINKKEAVVGPFLKNKMLQGSLFVTKIFWFIVSLD